VAASISSTGASRQVFDHALGQNWSLLVSPWVLRETRDNLARHSSAVRAWEALRTTVVIEEDALTFFWPVAFDASKDKPVIFTALACADVLLTLDRRDFRDLLGTTIYGLRVLTPGAFLRTEREAGRLG
jgi:predicted nucleic acid-binding protein